MFEDSIKELEKIDLFEKGIKLSKECNDMLDKAEKRVSVLIGGEKQEFKMDEE